ncbi:MAG: CDP-diacylglycerol--glycerol-3-phosphate 3-phosphatidyltransferase [Deltaproteobacteria bacterium]|nr:CDP-diacylglycerol--glycerol-3-phosphate 3-phosphatidyltransferase [Deltaproteobacteria bacterium]
MQSDRPKIWTIPNILTFSRILAVPVVIYFMQKGVVREQYFLWALIIYTLAFITDQIDGYLSRVLDQRTVLGEILDPIADKIIVLCVLIQLTYLNYMPAWVVMVLLTREILINGLRAFAQTRGLSILPSMSGKIKVYFQGFGLGFLMMTTYSPLASLPVHKIGMILIYISLWLSITSAFDYSNKLRKHLS